MAKYESATNPINIPTSELLLFETIENMTTKLSAIGVKLTVMASKSLTYVTLRYVNKLIKLYANMINDRVELHPLIIPLNEKPTNHNITAIAEICLLN